MPSIDFQQVRSIISINEVLDLLGFVAAARKGSQERGACPTEIRVCRSPRAVRFSIHDRGLVCRNTALFSSEPPRPLPEQWNQNMCRNPGGGRTQRCRASVP